MKRAGLFQGNLAAHEAEVSFAQRRKARAADRLAAAIAEDAAADAQLARALDDLRVWIAANPADQIEMFDPLSKCDGPPDSSAELVVS